ncbi:MAG: alpha-amylase family glycosyl hydrolase, partial [Candidatus Lokiarchaeota archaeon]
EKVEKAIKKLVEEYPPNKIYKRKVNVDEFLDQEIHGEKNKYRFQEEFINLWLANSNPSFSPYIDLFDDDLLEKNSIYPEITKEIQSFFEEKPKFGPKDQNLIDMLKEPMEKYPNSIKNQLEFIRENWAHLIGKYSRLILVALDLIREEEQFRGLGPGESRVLEYGDLEYENFTPDKEWMPKVVMIAKNTFVWLDQLSRKYNRKISRLDEIPGEELDQLRDWGFNALWLIGLWERSQASRTIKQWCGNPEAAPSAYSLYDYVIANKLGGKSAFENLKEKCRQRGIRLASDMVPNHTGIVSKWTMEHPDWYVGLPYPPFPSYNYSGENLSGDPNIMIQIEDKYFNRSDAAVTFKREDYRTGDLRYIYHGNDGTSFPWNDTAQLNFLKEEVREAVIQTILYVSRLFPIIRFDAAMTLTRKHFQRLWFPEPGTGGAIPSRAEHGMTREEFFDKMPNEFWREVVDRINEENPDTLLIAEAFWLLEGFFVRTLGMHRVYNSAFMNMLRDEDNAKFRAVLKNTLEFDPKILKRFVNFMNNPDEETAVKQFGDGGKYFGVCAMLVTMPGLPMFGHGQIQGFHEKYGMEYQKAYWNEEVNWGLLHHHERTIFPIMKKRYIFANVDNFYLYDFFTGDYVNEDVFAYSNKSNNERALVIYNNKYTETKGFIKRSVGFAIKDGDEKEVIQKTLSEGLKLPSEGYCIFKDYMSGLEYIRKNRDIYEQGLYVELNAFKCFVFMDFRIVQDDEFFHYAQLHDLLGGKGVQNMNETLQQLIYQSLHRPFEELVNKDIFTNLIKTKDIEKNLSGLSKILNSFLEEVKNYSNSDLKINIINTIIIEKLKIALNLKEELKSLNLENKIDHLIKKVLPKSNKEIGFLLSWVYIHLLGKLRNEKNYEIISMSWIDEWQLAKYIQRTLEQLKSSHDEDSYLTTPFLKILTLHQNLLNFEHLEENGEFFVIKKIFSDSDAQGYLHVNRFQ